MPSSIQPNSLNSSGVSFLPTFLQDSLSLEAFHPSFLNSVGDVEAEMLLDLWNNGERLNGHRYRVPNGFPNKNLIRLQSSGLISLNGNSVEFTSKASSVIKTMVLAEQNSFYQKRQKKPYSVILAESKRPVRKSQLTHTAQSRNTAPGANSVYISSRRLAMIDQDGDSDNFKEYTVRIYIGENGQYEVWGYGGRIGGNQTGWLKGVLPTPGSARQAADRVIDVQRGKGYQDASSYGQVRSKNSRRDGLRLYDLRGENLNLPGSYEPNATATGRPAPKVTPPARQPSVPVTPSTKPSNPPVIPTKHPEDRGLPKGYKIEGPTRVGLDEAGRPQTGYFVADQTGKPVPDSIADTPDKAIARAKPMLDFLSEEARLPEGYTIIRPKNGPQGVYISRDPTGLPIGAERSAREAVEKALEWAKTHPNIKGPTTPKTVVEKEDPVLIEQTKKASELSSLLPQGYKFQMGLKNYDPKSWYVINENGDVVSGMRDKDHVFATGKTPQEAFDRLKELERSHVKRLSNGFLDLLKDRFKGAKTKVNIKLASGEFEEEEEKEDETPVLGYYYNRVDGSRKNLKYKKEYLKKSSDFISQVSKVLGEFGFTAIPHVEEGGVASPGWADCLYFLGEEDRGMRLIIGFASDSSIDRLTPTIMVSTVSKSGATPIGKVYKHPPHKSAEYLARCMANLYKGENPNAQIRHLPGQIRTLKDILFEKMNGKRRL